MLKKYLHTKQVYRKGICFALETKLICLHENRKRNSFLWLKCGESTSFNKKGVHRAWYILISFCEALYPLKRLATLRKSSCTFPCLS